MKAVVDPNVLISALLSPRGTPARVMRAWLHGEFDLVVSPALLAELDRALTYPKLAKRVSRDEAAELHELLEREATVLDDSPSPPTVRSADPDDDYLIALAADARAALVSGDRHLLDLASSIPVSSPAQFLTILAQTVEGTDPTHT